MGVSELYGIPFYFGYHHSLNFPAEAVYNLLKALDAGASELVKLDAGFGPLAADPAGFQVKGIQSIPEVPVHPGLAKYLKEKGKWDSSWTIATEDTIKKAIEKMKAKLK